MSIGLILLLIAGLLLLFGAGQRVLDKLRLTDRMALLFIALMIALGFVPDIPVAPNFAVNLGGCVVPVILCLYVWFRAETAREKVRCIVSTVITAIAVYLIGRYAPNEPEQMLIDPNYLYGLAAGVIAYVFGRSRRGAFVAGVLGTLAANVYNAANLWAQGVDQRLVLGGAGAYDAVVISGLLAVLLCELTGEITERIVRGKRPPNRIFENGHFVEKEHRQ